MIIRICGTLTLYLCFVLFVLFCVRFRFVSIAFCVLVIFVLLFTLFCSGVAKA